MDTERTLLLKNSKESLVDLIINERRHNHRQFTRQIEEMRLIIDGINALSSVANGNFKGAPCEMRSYIQETENRKLQELIIEEWNLIKS